MLLGLSVVVPMPRTPTTPKAEAPSIMFCLLYSDFFTLWGGHDSVCTCYFRVRVPLARIVGDQAVSRSLYYSNTGRARTRGRATSPFALQKERKTYQKKIYIERESEGESERGRVAILAQVLRPLLWGLVTPSGFGGGGERCLRPHAAARFLKRALRF